MLMDRHHRDDQGGYTIVELAIVMLIMGIVSSSIVGLLVSQSKIEKHVSTSADNQEVLRQALIEVARDVRASDPIQWQANVTDYATQLPIRIREVTSDQDRLLRWRLDPATRQLLREELNASGAVTSVSYRVGGMSLQPIFTYYRADGTVYTLSGLDGGALDRCTVKVHVQLTGAPTSGPRPRTVRTDVQIRNRLPLPNEIWCTTGPTP